MIEKLNKLSLPATILIGSVILGSFYYASQVNKQNSIEKQQRMEIQAATDAEQAQRERDAMERLGRMTCAETAEQLATKQYEETCTYDCKEGYYYTANYDNYYNSCLRSKGLE